MRIAIILLADSDDIQSQSEASTVDLSQHGCRIQAGAPLNEGQRVEIIPVQSPEAAVLGRVVWVGEPVSDLVREVGVEFVSPLPATF